MVFTATDNCSINRSVYNFAGAPIDNELLKKVIDAHDPNKTDAIDYSVFLTGKKFVNKVMVVHINHGNSYINEICLGVIL